MAVLDSNEIFFTTFEPKVKNRYLMYIDGIPAFMINKVDPPKFADAVKTVDHINTYFNIRGKRKWENVNITLYDPVTPSGAQACMDWARLGYEAVSGRSGYSDWYKKDVTLDILGPVGDIVSEWIYKGAFVANMSPEGLEWSNDGDPANIQLTLAYDYAILNY